MGDLLFGTNIFRTKENKIPPCLLNQWAVLLSHIRYGNRPVWHNYLFYRNFLHIPKEGGGMALPAVLPPFCFMWNIIEGESSSHPPVSCETRIAAWLKSHFYPQTLWCCSLPKSLPRQFDQSGTKLPVSLIEMPDEICYNKYMLFAFWNIWIAAAGNNAWELIEWVK